MQNQLSGLYNAFPFYHESVTKKKHPKIKYLKKSRKIWPTTTFSKAIFMFMTFHSLKSSWRPQMNSMQAAIGKFLQRYADLQPFITILGVSSASHLRKIWIKKNNKMGEKNTNPPKFSVSTNQRNLWKPSTALRDKFRPFVLIRPDSFPLPVRLCSADQNFGTSIDLGTFQSLGGTFWRSQLWK